MHVVVRLMVYYFHFIYLFSQRNYFENIFFNAILYIHGLSKFGISLPLCIWHPVAEWTSARPFLAPRGSELLTLVRPCRLLLCIRCQASVTSWAVTNYSSCRKNHRYKPLWRSWTKMSPGWGGLFFGGVNQLPLDLDNQQELIWLQQIMSLNEIESLILVVRLLHLIGFTCSFATLLFYYA